MEKKEYKLNTEPVFDHFSIADYGIEFEKWFQDKLLHKTESCFERDIYRDCKEQLRQAYFKRAGEYDRREVVEPMVEKI